jgi:hypothetical protein
MAFTISSETQQFIETRMKQCGVENSDEFLKLAVQQFSMDAVEYYEDLDEETRAAIERADLQPDIPQEQAEQRILNLMAKK